MIESLFESPSTVLGGRSAEDVELAQRARDALYDVPDPETGIDIVSLGLVYGVQADASSGVVDVTVTFTTPACPAGDTILAAIERRLTREPAVRSVKLSLCFEPRWTPERISAEARERLGIDD